MRARQRSVPRLPRLPRLPAGVVAKGLTLVDESMLTGESRAVAKAAGSSVISGTLNCGVGALEVRATAAVKDSTVSRLAAMIEQAASQKSSKERLVERFARVGACACLPAWGCGSCLPGAACLPGCLAALAALDLPAAGQSCCSGASAAHGSPPAPCQPLRPRPRCAPQVYTPLVVLAAVLVAAVPTAAGIGHWRDWVYLALVCLVTSCPCALVISTPVTSMCGIARAAQQGVLIKGSRWAPAPPCCALPGDWLGCALRAGGHIQVPGWLLVPSCIRSPTVAPSHPYTLPTPRPHPPPTHPCQVPRGTAQAGRDVL
jgi:magnesium-transporting ATPase (P-type)